MPSNILAKINEENRRDIIATLFAVPWQVVLFLTGMMIVMKQWSNFINLFGLLIILSFGLYWFWFRHLSKRGENRILRIILFSFSFVFAQSLDVTFRYVENPNDDFVRNFVPGTMPSGTSNDWGPNSNGMISPNALSKMT